MFKFIKKTFLIFFIVMFSGTVHADWWSKGANSQLYTNGGNGLGNSIINVAGCGGCSNSGFPIGGTITNGTTGSLLFIGSTPVLQQNNSKLFWDNTNNFLGIDTNTPVSTLDIAIGTKILSAVNFSGSGLNDLSLSGIYTGVTNISYKVNIAKTSGISTIASSPTAGGTGYTVGDLLTITTGGTGGSVRVSSVNGSGVVLTVATTLSGPTPRSNPGNNYTVGTGKVTTGGTGTGCTINIISVSDFFQFFQNNVGTSLVAITGSSQSMGNGISITFGSTSGHTLNNNWTWIANSTGDINASNSYSLAGYSVLSQDLTVNKNNLLIGYQAGEYVLQNSGSAIQNTFIGVGAGKVVSTGSVNTFIGDNTGAAIINGTNNVAIGHFALGQSLNSSYNTAIGVSAGGGSQNMNYGTFIGYQAGLNNQSDYNTMIGYISGNTHSTGAYNTYLGYESGYNDTTGTRNNYFGASAGYSDPGGASGARNNFHGTSAGDFITTGSDNIFMGDQSGNATTSGNSNLYLGTNAGHNTTIGSNNACLGYKVCDTLISGSNNIGIGYDIDFPSINGSNQLTIGNLIFGTGLDATGTSLASGNVGIGVASPTATLHLRASTTAANTASLKIDPGTVATSPVNGNIESDGTHLYWTDSSNVRHQLDN